MWFDWEVRCEDVDIADVSRFRFSSKEAEELVRNPQPTEHLLWIAESIREHGFIPNYDGYSYPEHRDVNPYAPHSFVLMEREDGTLDVLVGVRRLAAARLLGLKTVPAYVARPKNYSEWQLNRFRQIAEKLEKMDIYESWELPGGIYVSKRDKSREIFEYFTSIVPTQAFAGRTVLDIACSTGYFAIRAANLGASYVEGFDVRGDVIEIAKEIAETFNFPSEVKFFQCEFWDYKPSRKFDIVFCNQAIYHFTTKHRSKCLGNQDEVLDRISSWTDKLLLMYTYVDAPSPWINPEEGYYPTSEKITEDLQKRGFKTVIIKHFMPGGKKHVVASKWGVEKMIKPKTYESGIIDACGWGEYRYLLFTLPVILKAKTIVETGLGQGNSTVIFLEACRFLGDCKLYTFEININKEDTLPARKRISELGLEPWWTLIEKDSVQAGREWSYGKIDVLFLDSHHSYEHVLAELEAFKPHLSEKAVILCHDTNPKEEHEMYKTGGPLRALKEFQTENPNWKLINLKANNGMGVLVRLERSNYNSA
jgi:predicted O-methyltransferase YrrM